MFGTIQKAELFLQTTKIRKTMLYDVLKQIEVTNWYCGEVTALFAFSNQCALSKKDIAKIRRKIKPYGYTMQTDDGTIAKFTKQVNE